VRVNQIGLNLARGVIISKVEFIKEYVIASILQNVNNNEISSKDSNPNYLTVSLNHNW